MRKGVIEEEGGLSHYAQYLAEDYFMAETFLKKYVIYLLVVPFCM